VAWLGTYQSSRLGQAPLIQPRRYFFWLGPWLGLGGWLGCQLGQDVDMSAGCRSDLRCMQSEIPSGSSVLLTRLSACPRVTKAVTATVHAYKTETIPGNSPSTTKLLTTDQVSATLTQHRSTKHPSNQSITTQHHQCTAHHHDYHRATWHSVPSPPRPLVLRPLVLDGIRLLPAAAALPATRTTVPDPPFAAEAIRLVHLVHLFYRTRGQAPLFLLPRPRARAHSLAQRTRNTAVLVPA
jgi:hypothetical protein